MRMGIFEREKIMKNTFMQKKETVERKWYVLDATDLPLGRVATKAAHILRGKHKVTFTPHIDCGDYIIITNASKVKLTGNKLNDKMYYNQSKEEGKLLNPDDTVSVDYIQKYNKLADEAVSISDSIIVYDLIKMEVAKEKLTSEVTNESK